MAKCLLKSAFSGIGDEAVTDFRAIPFACPSRDGRIGILLYGQVAAGLDETTGFMNCLKPLFQSPAATQTVAATWDSASCNQQRFHLLALLAMLLRAANARSRASS